MGSDVGVGGLAGGAEVEINAVCAVPPRTAYGLLVTSIACDAAVNNALLSCTVLCDVIQGALECLPIRIETLTVSILVAVP